MEKTEVRSVISLLLRKIFKQRTPWKLTNNVRSGQLILTWSFKMNPLVDVQKENNFVQIIKNSAKKDMKLWVKLGFIII